ncbi:hypothetical protein YQE_07424, partial [Dendroctonus ponderosae]
MIGIGQSLAALGMSLVPSTNILNLVGKLATLMVRTDGRQQDVNYVLDFSQKPGFVQTSKKNDTKYRPGGQKHVFFHNRSRAGGVWVLLHAGDGNFRLRRPVGFSGSVWKISKASKGQSGLYNGGFERNRRTYGLCFGQGRRPSGFNSAPKFGIAASQAAMPRRISAVSLGQLADKDVLVIPMDVLDLASHKAHFQYALRHFGTVDVLVNNAGRSQRALFDDTDLAVDRQVFELNVFAVINLTRVALAHFSQKGQGHVVVVSSVAGVLDVPFSASYTASKHALHGYLNSLRVEKSRKNIHVTLLCPGPVFTNFLSEAFTDKDGEKLDGSTRSTDKRMSAQRCGQLNAVAIANKVSEAWIARFPMVPMVYIGVYFPILLKVALRLVGPEKLFAARDSKEFGPTEVKVV